MIHWPLLSNPLISKQKFLISPSPPIAVASAAQKQKNVLYCFDNVQIGILRILNPNMTEKHRYIFIMENIVYIKCTKIRK